MRGGRLAYRRGALPVGPEANGGIMTGQKTLVFRFGDFEVREQDFALTRAREPVPVEPKAFRVLLFLLRNPDRLIKKDEILNAVWEDCSVSDNSLTRSIATIRRLLGDDSRKPRYIETLATVGYRFICKVEVSEISDGASEIPKSVPDHAANLRKIAAIVVLTAALVLIVAGWLYIRSVRNRRLTDNDIIVLSDFSNSTGEVVFDDTLKTALDVSLRQSPFLNLLPESDVANTLKLMTLSAGERLTPAVARELCQRTGSKAYVTGSIARLGSQYVVEVKALNCQSGNILAQEQVTAVSRETVLDALGRGASKLRSELGESLTMVRRFDVPLEQATTSSLEALQAFSLGKKAEGETTSASALPYSLRAIQLDPKFALAYSAAGWDYIGLSELGRAREYMSKAFQLRDHASERERLSITGDYYFLATGELDKAVLANQQRVDTYPRDYDGYSTLGDAYSYLGQYQKAAEIQRKALPLAPPRGNIYNSLVRDTIALQHFDEAMQILRAEQARKLDHGYLHTLLYALGFLHSDQKAMEAQQQWFEGRSEENIGLALVSCTEAYGGHLSRARELIRRAVASAIRADSKESGAISQAISAHREAAFGNAEVARRTAEAALKLAPKSQGVESESALAFAIVGDTAQAESLSRDLEKRFPVDTQIQAHWLPAIRAQLDLNRKKPILSLRSLQSDSSIELGVDSFADSTSCLHPVYLRGEAYLAAGQGQDAAKEFQKIIDHSGIVWNCWTGALARLGVARANALLSKTRLGADADAARARALASYTDFLTLWKDADPDIPILKHAQREYAKVKESVR